MNKTIPFTNDIIFKTKIASITSISLEHNVEKKEHELTGNFIISGEYKVHEVSVNKEKFEYTLPFSVELPDNVIKDTINFDINDFTYDIIHDDTLRVNIEFNVLADLKKEEEIPTLEEKESIEEEVRETVELEEKPVLKVEEITSAKEELNNVDNNDREVDEDIKNDIISSINNEDEEYVTYYVHIVRENETIESICEKLNTTREVMEKFNDLSNVSINDKLIIPKTVDE